MEKSTTGKLRSYKKIKNTLLWELLRITLLFKKSPDKT